MARGGAPKRRANAAPPAARKRTKDCDSEAPHEPADSAPDSALCHFPGRSPSTPLNLPQAEQLPDEPHLAARARACRGAPGAREPAPLQAMLSSLSSLPRKVRLSESAVGRAGVAVAETVAGLEAPAQAAPRPAPNGGWYADVARACDLAARLVHHACNACATAAAAGAETAPDAHDLLAKVQLVRRMAVEQEKLQIAGTQLLHSRVSEAGACCIEASEELKTHMAAQDDAVMRVVKYAAMQLEAQGDDAMEMVDRLLRGEEEGGVRETLAWLTSAKAAYDEAYAIKAFPTQIAPELPPLDLPQVYPPCEPPARTSLLAPSLVCSLLPALLCARVAEK